MKQTNPEAISIVHDRVPNRIRFSVPMIRHKRTFAELLKHSLLKAPEGKGIYHAEPNIVTGTLLIKFHPAIHTREEVVHLVEDLTSKIDAGEVEITQKHKNPRLGKMLPGAFFTRELLVSIVGNVVAGLLLAFMITR
jgi:hypothetical protein